MSKPPPFFNFVLCLGIDFGYTSTLKRKRKWLTKCFHLSMVLLNIVIPILPALFDQITSDDANMPEKKTNFSQFTEGTRSFWNLSISLQFVMYTVVLLKSKYGLCHFFLDLEDCDSRFREIVGSLVGKITWGFVTFMFLSKVLFPLTICFENERYYCNFFFILRFMFYQIPTISIDLINFELFMIYYYVYKFVRNLKIRLRNSEIDLRLLRKQYAGVANCLEKINPEYDMLLSIELVTDLPKLLGMLWITLYFTKIEDTIWLVYMASVLHIINIILQVFLPAFMVSMVMSQVDEMNVILHDQLLREQKENTEVLSVLRYMSARPMHHQLWQVFPTDLRLPISLFSLCVTYLIALIQFSHLSD